MKKALFTIQVFFLIAMFPAYLILELTFERGEYREVKINPIIRENSGSQTNGLFKDLGDIRYPAKVKNLTRAGKATQAYM
jgi:hypothetical protein